MDNELKVPNHIAIILDGVNNADGRKNAICRAATAISSDATIWKKCVT